MVRERQGPLVAEIASSPGTEMGDADGRLSFPLRLWRCRVRVGEEQASLLMTGGSSSRRLVSWLGASRHKSEEIRLPKEESAGYRGRGWCRCVGLSLKPYLRELGLQHWVRGIQICCRSCMDGCWGSLSILDGQPRTPRCRRSRRGLPARPSWIPKRVRLAILFCLVTQSSYVGDRYLITCPSEKATPHTWRLQPDSSSKGGSR